MKVDLAKVSSSLGRFKFLFTLHGIVDLSGTKV